MGTREMEISLRSVVPKFTSVTCCNAGWELMQIIRSTVTTKTPDKTSALDEMRGMTFGIKISPFFSL